MCSETNEWWGYSTTINYSRLRVSLTKTLVVFQSFGICSAIHQSYRQMQLHKKKVVEEMADFKLNDQVVIRQSRLAGRSTMSVLKVGTIIAFHDSGKTAVVSIPSDHVKTTVKTSTLERPKNVYGR